MNDLEIGENWLRLQVRAPMKSLLTRCDGRFSLSSIGLYFTFQHMSPGGPWKRMAVTIFSNVPAKPHFEFSVPFSLITLEESTPKKVVEKVRSREVGRAG